MEEMCGIHLFEGEKNCHDFEIAYERKSGEGKRARATRIKLYSWRESHSCALCVYIAHAFLYSYHGMCERVNAIGINGKVCAQPILVEKYIQLVWGTFFRALLSFFLVLSFPRWKQLEEMEWYKWPHGKHWIRNMAWKCKTGNNNSNYNNMHKN